jgi:NAD-dependent DNA ligase
MTYKKGANARNTASGIVNSKKNMTNASVLTFLAYNLIEKKSKHFQNTKDEKDLLKNVYGFTTVDFKKVVRDDMNFEMLSNYLNHRRSVSEVEIDGLVVSCNDDCVISKGKNPDYAFAFKYFITQDKAEVIVKTVEWKVSKDGLLKPVVVFDPVHISGTNISRATGFNGDFIKNNEIGPGSRITIIRSGDVIPHIESVISKSTALMPESKYIWIGKDIKIEGSEKNSEQQLQELINFFNILDVKGVGPGLIKKLYDEGYCTPVSVYKMTVDNFIKIQGFSNKSELFKEIKKVIENSDCVTLMHASNKFGKGFGAKKLQLIVDGLGKKDMAYVPQYDEIIKVKGVSDITAKNYIDGMNQFKIFLEDMGIASKCSKKSPSSVKTSPVSSIWKGQTVVFSGIRNKDLEKFITENGGKVTTSISKNTTMVLTKDVEASTDKLDKARTLGIKIDDITKYI